MSEICMQKLHDPEVESKLELFDRFGRTCSIFHSFHCVSFYQISSYRLGNVLDYGTFTIISIHILTLFRLIKLAKTTKKPFNSILQKKNCSKMFHFQDRSESFKKHRFPSILAVILSPSNRSPALRV